MPRDLGESSGNTFSSLLTSVLICFHSFLTLNKSGNIVGMQDFLYTQILPSCVENIEGCSDDCVFDRAPLLPTLGQLKLVQMSLNLESYPHPRLNLFRILVKSRGLLQSLRQPKMPTLEFCFLGPKGEFRDMRQLRR